LQSFNQFNQSFNSTRTRQDHTETDLRERRFGDVNKANSVSTDRILVQAASDLKVLGFAPLLCFSKRYKTKQKKIQIGSLCGTPVCGTPVCGTPVCGTPVCQNDNTRLNVNGGYN
jgi:hypothetical protein